MKEKELVHVKLEYGEAFEGKRDILSSEVCFLEIARNIRRYNLLRQEELKRKLRIYKKIREINSSINKLKQILPKVRIPEIVRRETGENEMEKLQKSIIKTKQRAEKNNIESQIQEIQDKLKQLAR